MNSLLTIEKFPLVSSYENYKKWVKSIPNLTEEEEKGLFQTIEANNNQNEVIQSAQKLVFSQLKTVIKIAEQHKNYGLPNEDLVQEGNIGLMKAIKNYKLGHSTRLYSYALIWIKSEIQSYILKNWKIVKAATTNNLKKLFFNFRSTQNELLKNGVSQEDLVKSIASKLQVDESEVREMQKYLLEGDMSLSFNNDDNENSQSFIDIPDFNTPEKNYEKNVDSLKINNKLQKAIKTLNEKQQLVIEQRYFLDDKKTHKEIAQTLGVSAERVRQLELEAIGKLKPLLN